MKINEQIITDVINVFNEFSQPYNLRMVARDYFNSLNFVERGAIIAEVRESSLFVTGTKSLSDACIELIVENIK